MDAQQAVRDKAGRPAREHVPLEHMLSLNEVPLFSELSKRHLRRVTKLVEIRRYRSVPVVRAGARGDSFHVILDGRADVHPLTGRDVVLEPGDSFGELSLLDGAPRDATVSAVGELTTACIRRSAFQELLRTEPGLGLGVARGLVSLVRGIRSEEPAPRIAQPPAETPAAGKDEGMYIGGRTSLGWLSTLSRVPLFAELKGRHLSRVIRLARLRRFAAGTAIVREGGSGDSFHILLDGRAQVEGPGGRILEAGDSFGELALLDGKPRAATVIATDDVTTARIARTDFVNLLRAEPQVGMGVLRGLVRIVRSFEAQAQGA
jgi:CRP-like cAMP-binding protein